MTLIENILAFQFNYKMNISFIKKIVFLKVPSLITISIPLLLITGPFLTDLGISLCALIFLINSYFNKDIIKKYLSKKVFIIYIFFCLYLIFNSIFFSSDILFSLKNSLFYFRFGLFALSFWFLLDNNEDILRQITYCLLACFLLLNIDGIYQYIFGINLIGIEINPTPRISSFFDEELVFGGYLSRLLPLLIALFFFYKKNNLNKFQKICGVILILITYISIFLSGEITALFFSILILFLAIILIRGYSKFKISIFFIMIFTFGTLFNLEIDAKKRMIDNTINQIFNEDKSAFVIFSKNHSAHYATAMKMFFDNPVFGKGHKNFRILCSDKKFEVSDLSCSTHPHNTYLQLLAENGIVGFIFVMILFLFISIKLIKVFIEKYSIKTKKYKAITNFEICLYISILISLWPLSPSGNFFNNWISAIYYYPIGIILWSRNKKVSKVLD